MEKSHYKSQDIEKKEIKSFITTNFGDIKNNPNSYSSINLANKNGKKKYFFKFFFKFPFKKIILNIFILNQNSFPISSY